MTERGANGVHLRLDTPRVEQPVETQPRMAGRNRTDCVAEYLQIRKPQVILKARSPVMVFSIDPVSSCPSLWIHE